MSTTTTTKVRNYQGSNSFVLKMKSALEKYGSLTENQSKAVEKILNSPMNVKPQELFGDLKKIGEYEGVNKFVLDVKAKLLTFGTLSENQVRVAIKQIESEQDKKNTIKLKIPTVGETIRVGRVVGAGLKEKYGLKFNPIILDITKLLGVSPKAVKFEAKLTSKRGKVCCVCNKTLTDELSMLSGIGKQCSEHVGIPYLKDKTQAESFRNEYLKRIEEIGTMEVWVPKSQLKVWNGHTEVILDLINL